ncbi:hypothetical protein PMLGA01_080026500, partial [Plasmodium malariae]
EDEIDEDAIDEEAIDEEAIDEEAIDEDEINKDEIDKDEIDKDEADDDDVNNDEIDHGEFFQRGKGQNCARTKVHSTIKPNFSFVKTSAFNNKEGRKSNYDDIYGNALSRDNNKNTQEQEEIMQNGQIFESENKDNDSNRSCYIISSDEDCESERYATNASGGQRVQGNISSASGASDADDADDEDDGEENDGSDEYYEEENSLNQEGEEGEEGEEGDYDEMAIYGGEVDEQREEEEEDEDEVEEDLEEGLSERLEEDLGEDLAERLEDELDEGGEEYDEYNSGEEENDQGEEPYDEYNSRDKDNEEGKQNREDDHEHVQKGEYIENYVYDENVKEIDVENENVEEAVEEAVEEPVEEAVEEAAEEAIEESVEESVKDAEEEAVEEAVEEEEDHLDKVVSSNVDRSNLIEELDTFHNDDNNVNADKYNSSCEDEHASEEPLNEMNINKNDGITNNFNILNSSNRDVQNNLMAYAANIDHVGAISIASSNENNEAYCEEGAEEEEEEEEGGLQIVDNVDNIANIDDISGEEVNIEQEVDKKENLDNSNPEE